MLHKVLATLFYNDNPVANFLGGRVDGLDVKQNFIQQKLVKFADVVEHNPKYTAVAFGGIASFVIFLALLATGVTLCVVYRKSLVNGLTSQAHIGRFHPKIWHIILFTAGCTTLAIPIAGFVGFAGGIMIAVIKHNLS